MMTIYEPAGRACEYAAKALNIYTGCNHGCTYRFNRSIPWYDGHKFNRPEPRPQLLTHLTAWLEKFHAPKEEILLCFTCDPYPDIENTLTRDALLTLELHKCKATVLTKGGLRAVRDFDILKRNAWRFGTTLTTLDSEQARVWEPGAPDPWERLAIMMAAKKEGIKTWLSLEPVYDPASALTLIDMIKDKEIVDEWKIGKWNHDERAGLINWDIFHREASKLLKGQKVYWKKDLLVAAGESKS